MNYEDTVHLVSLLVLNSPEKLLDKEHEEDDGSVHEGDVVHRPT